MALAPTESAFLADVQLRFLLAASRLGVAASPESSEELPAWFEEQRRLLLERAPGFRETLMGWPGPPSATLPSASSSLGVSSLGVSSPAAPAFTAEGMGQVYEAFLGRAARQRQGTFYTARPMIRRLLGAPMAHARPRILDLAMGCGSFLSEALALRALSDPRERWEFACSALFGVERDAIARELAVLALWLQIGHPEGDPRHLRRNLRLGNSLLPPGDDPETSGVLVRAPAGFDSQAGGAGIDWERDFPEPMREGGFTALVGNPPFVNIERLDPVEKRRYREAFPALRKRFDLFVPMAERALDLTRPGGHLALVLPQAFLNQAYAEALRRRFLTETTLLRLEEAAFPGASVRTVLLSAVKEAAPPDHRLLLGPLDGTAPAEALPQAPLAGLPEARIPSRGGAPFTLALQALERGLPLGAVAFATWGIRGVPIAAFHRDAPDHDSCRPMIKGEGIEPYHVTWGGKWLRYEPARLYRPLFRELFEGEKIVLRKVSGKRGLVAALDRKGFYADDSVLCCQLRSQLPARLARRYGGTTPDPALAPYDLPILLALLNSRLAALVFSQLLGNGLNVYPAAVMRLPLPPYDPERFASIRSLVACRQEALATRVEAIDREIEAQLAALFALPVTELSAE